VSVGTSARPSTSDRLGDEALKAHRARMRLRGRWRIVRRLLLLASILTVWELFGRSVSPVFFPTFTSTIETWFRLAGNGALLEAILESLSSMLLGFGIAISVGLPVGLLMGRYRTADAILQMYMSALIAVPMVAVFPFVIVILGVRYAAEVSVVVLFVVVYIVVTTAAGVRSTSRELLEMGRSFQLTERQQFRWIMIPTAAPLVMAGIRLGFGRAVTGMLLAQLLLTSAGFGGLLNAASANFNTAQTFATVLTILMLAVVGAGLIQGLDRRVNRWRPDVR
jgi:NitT/TauT family transport system permease protein